MTTAGSYRHFTGPIPARTGIIPALYRLIPALCRLIPALYRLIPALYWLIPALYRIISEQYRLIPAPHRHYRGTNTARRCGSSKLLTVPNIHTWYIFSTGNDYVTGPKGRSATRATRACSLFLMATKYQCGRKLENRLIFIEYTKTDIITSVNVPRDMRTAIHTLAFFGFFFILPFTFQLNS